MTGRVGADLDGLRTLRHVLGRRADDVDDGAAAIGWSIGRFRAASSEYVPPLPPHHARGTVLAERLDDLGHRVARTHEALLAADRWVGTSTALWAVGRMGEVDTAVDGWHLAGALRQGPGFDPRTSPWLRGAAARSLLADTVHDLRHVTGPASRIAGPTGGAARGIAANVDRFWASRAGAVTRLGGRALGVAGLTLGVVDTVDAARAGDEARAVASGLGVAAGAAMLSGIPPLQIAGAIVSGGLLLHAYRDELADGARAAGRVVSDAASAAVGFLRNGLF